jgi:hypothetical protein
MKIAIDLTPLHGRKWTGVELYAIDLYHALLELNYEVIPIFHVKNDLDDNPNSFIIKPTKRLLLENFALSKAIRTTLLYSRYSLLLLMSISVVKPR